MPRDRRKVNVPTVVPRGNRLLRTAALALCALACLSVSHHTVRGQAPAHSPLHAELVEKLDRPGDLTLRNTSLRDALFTISELWKINIVIGSEVEGTVNGVFQQAPLREILDAFLLSNGYSYRPVGQSLVIMKLAELGDLNPLFETATISVGAADASDLVAGAELLSSPQGKVKAIPSARSLLVIDYPDRVARIRAFVGELIGQSAPLDALPTQLQVIQLAPQFIPAVALKEALATVLSAEGKLSALEKDNRLVVMDYPANLRMVEEVLHRLDVPRPQVRITAYIYDVALEDMEQLGFNWGHALKGRYGAHNVPQSVWAIDTLTTVPLAAGPVGGAMTFANMSKAFNLTTVIQALDTCKNSQLLADPNVVVIDNEPAEIAIIQEIPYQQLTQTAQGGQIGTTSFREAGVKLTVTPRIASDGTISMNVVPEFSRLTGYTPEDNQPIIDRRTARTNVRVVNGHTLVIGGLRQRSDISERNGIPYLQNLPYLGFLFRSRSEVIRESELLVFLKPEIVDAYQMPSGREQAALESAQGFLGNVPAPKCPPGAIPPGAVIESAPAEVLPPPATRRDSPRRNRIGLKPSARTAARQKLDPPSPPPIRTLQRLPSFDEGPPSPQFVQSPPAAPRRLPPLEEVGRGPVWVAEQPQSPPR